MEPMEKVIEDSKIKVGDIVMVVTEGSESISGHCFMVGQLVEVISVHDVKYVVEGRYKGEKDIKPRDVQQQLMHSEVINTYICLVGGRVR